MVVHVGKGDAKEIARRDERTRTGVARVNEDFDGARLRPKLTAERKARE